MNKIAIVSNGYAWFPCESGPSRFYYIAKVFANAGWDVEVITVDYQHFKKKPRDKVTILAQGYPFKITFVHAPAYKKNIDLRRVFSNAVVERNIVSNLKNRITEFNVVYCSIPANNVAAEVSKLCKANNVPIIIDIEDLWPEAMSMVIKSEKARQFLLHKMLVDAETAYKNASGIVGTSEDYTQRAFKKQKRNIPAETVYVGCDLSDFDQGVMDNSDRVEKADGEFWVTYAGSISTSYDIKTLIDAGRELAKDNIHIQILGTGSLKEELEKYSVSNKLDNVHFWGFTEYHLMAAVLKKSDVVINSFVKGAPQSIVNKIGDYLGSGKPIINTLENPVFCKLIDDNNVGINIEPENVPALQNAIYKFYFNPQMTKELGDNGRKLAEERFDRKVAYQKLIELVNKVIE